MFSDPPAVVPDDCDLFSNGVQRMIFTPAPTQAFPKVASEPDWTTGCGRTYQWCRYYSITNHISTENCTDCEFFNRKTAKKDALVL